MRPFWAFRTLILGGCLCAAACDGWDLEAPPAAVLPGPPEWNRVVVEPSDEVAASERGACAYAAGSLPAETQGVSHPNGAEIPIDHVFVIMMENRSFDHYFQKLPERGQPDADVAPADFQNLDSDGVPVPIFHQRAYCFADPNHGWAGTAEQIGAGEMGGFVTSNEGFHEMPGRGDLEMFSGRRAMGYYDDSDIPFYYWLANEFALGDRYFSALPGPTYPNRMYLYAASSFGHVHNDIPGPADTIADLLQKRQIDWRVYASSTPGLALFLNTLAFLPDHVRSIDQLASDAAADALPEFAFIDPEIGASTGQHDTNDEHPPALAQLGQRFVAEVVDAIAKSPAWPRSAIFLIYDEHGGLYDHVPPPPACPPDDMAPVLERGEPPGAFDRLGLRVPFIVVSPYARRHYVSHTVYDHTSIVRFVEARFVMPALTARDANALAPWDMFDFADPPHLEPPEVPIPPLPSDELDACAAIFP